MDIRKFFGAKPAAAATGPSGKAEAAEHAGKTRLQTGSSKNSPTKAQGKKDSAGSSKAKKASPIKDPIVIPSDEDSRAKTVEKSTKARRQSKQPTESKSRKRKADDIDMSDSEDEQPKRMALRNGSENEVSSSAKSKSKAKNKVSESPLANSKSTGKGGEKATNAKSAKSPDAKQLSSPKGKLTKLSEGNSSSKQPVSQAIEISESDNDDEEDIIPVKRGRKSRKRVDSGSSASNSKPTSPVSPRRRGHGSLASHDDAISPPRNKIDFYAKPAAKATKLAEPTPQPVAAAPKVVDPAAFFNSSAIVRTDKKSTAKAAPASPSKKNPVAEFVTDPLESQRKDKVKETATSKEDSTKTTQATSPAKAKKPNSPKAKPAKAVSPKAKVAAAPAGNAELNETPQTPAPAARRTSFMAHMNREGPRALGTRSLPAPVRGSLTGVTFVLTGEMETVTREDAKALIEACDGKVTVAVSRRTTYLVVGRECGQSKTAKANEFGVRTLDEDAFYSLLEERLKSKASSQPAQSRSLPASADGEFMETCVIPATPLPKSQPPAKSVKQAVTPDVKPKTSEVAPTTPSATAASSSGGSQLWVDKYKPSGLKQLVGQQGDRSCAQKLSAWLRNWYSHHSTAAKAKAGPKASGTSYWAARNADDGRLFKAALLSGPAGVGKTSTATVCCREAGLHIIELNASDKRSKKSMTECVAEAMQSYSLSDLASGHGRRPQHCLIMDEVDGMSGNEDRGGVQELIQLIKKSRIPVICICNDRQHPKIRSLANYCFDLRFMRPRVEQVFGALLSIAFKEGYTQPRLTQLGLSSESINEMVMSTNNDIRQSIHNLQMLCVGAALSQKVDANKPSSQSSTQSQSQGESSQQSASKVRVSGLKDVHVSPFDACRLVFTQQSGDTRLSVNERMDLFFTDAQIAPLFVFENYPLVTPSKPMLGATFQPNYLPDTSPHVISMSARPAVPATKQKTKLDWMALTADSISFGDIVERQIRETVSWQLMPVEALFTSVVPGEFMRGSIGNLIQFPSWFGRNSTANKNRRILQQCAMHASVRSRFTPQTFACDCAEIMRRRLVDPLLQQGADGVNEIVEFANSYYLQKEDVDGLLEVLDNGAASGDQQEESATASTSINKDWRSQVEPKVKAALTRAFNKQTVALPYVLEAPVKKRRGKAGGDLEGNEDEEDGAGSGSEAGESDDDAAHDAMIKAKPASKATAKQTAPTTSKATGKAAKKK